MADGMTITFDPANFLQNITIASLKAHKAAERGLEDCANELSRISSEIAPIDKGTLRKSHEETMNTKVGELSATVEFSINEQQLNGKNFNYGLWMHEGEYNLGEQSSQAPGTTGWSGMHYPVGNKYVERPAKGEDEAFKKHIADEIRADIGD